MPESRETRDVKQTVQRNCRNAQKIGSNSVQSTRRLVTIHCLVQIMKTMTMLYNAHGREYNNFLTSICSEKREHGHRASHGFPARSCRAEAVAVNVMHFALHS